MNKATLSAIDALHDLGFVIVGLREENEQITVQGRRLHKATKTRKWYDVSGNVYDHRLDPFSYKLDLSVSLLPEDKVQLVTLAKFGPAPLIDPCVYGHVYAAYQHALTGDKAAK